jgi:hypothetical protein
VGLLPDVEQVPDRYHGSTVFYPPGSCAQIAATARLFQIKNRAEFVGFELWWEGFPVDERYWRPKLEDRAKHLDDLVARIRTLIAKDEAGIAVPTLQEQLAQSGVSNLIISRVLKRLSGRALEAFYGVVLSIVSGDFQGFAEPAGSEKRSFDRDTVNSAFDIAVGRTHAVMGNRLRLSEALPGTLRDISRAMRGAPFAELLQTNCHEINAARDDARNALRIACALYEGTSWFYGPEAFGLRLAAWIATKRPRLLVERLVLGFAQLRKYSADLLSSEEIKRLADHAETMCHRSREVRTLGQTAPRFAKVFSPKRVREGLRDQPSLNRWNRDVELASDYA